MNFHSGTVKTTATVNAATSANGSLLRSSSDPISISTGVATQKSLSLSLTPFNPFALSTDGVEVDVIIRASDFYQNPIPDGAKVAFFTSGGQIDPDCTVSSETGSCSVKWRSQNPRPLNGRVIIMAMLKGEETQLTDVNADGRYGKDDTFEPLPEAFLDANWDRQWNSGELYIDTNGNAIGDPARDVEAGDAYKGVRCDDSTTCLGLTDIFTDHGLVMSGRVNTAGITPDASAISINAGMNFFSFTIADPNNNAPAVGTTISAQFTPEDVDGDEDGDGDVLVEADSVEVSDRAIYPQKYDLSIKGDGKPSTGLLTIIVENPDNTFAKKSYNVIES